MLGGTIMDLTLTNFEQYIFDKRSLNGGQQLLMKFPNGFGASVVSSPISYGGNEGKLELAVIEFKGTDKFALTYDTEITDDVLGHLTKEDCFDYFNKIMGLKAPNKSLDSDGKKRCLK